MKKQKTIKGEQNKRYGPSPLQGAFSAMCQIEKIDRWRKAWLAKNTEKNNA